LDKGSLDLIILCYAGLEKSCALWDL
jgi:hypothetical protein